MTKNRLIKSKKLKLLARGNFSTCYLDSRNMSVYSFVKMEEDSKDLFNLMGYSPHFPEFELIENYDREILYTSPYYLPLSGQALREYETLEFYYCTLLSQTKLYLRECKKMLADFIALITDKVSSTLLNAFIMLSEVITDDYMLDIKPDNVKQDEHNNLILLDVFYNLNAL